MVRASAPPGLYASILAKQPHLFASVPVFMKRAHAEAISSIVRAVERAVANGRLHLAALDRAVEVGLDALERVVGRAGLCVEQPHRMAALRRQLRDARTHAAGADDGDRGRGVQGVGHGCSVAGLNGDRNAPRTAGKRDRRLEKQIRPPGR